MGGEVEHVGCPDGGAAEAASGEEEGGFVGGSGEGGRAERSLKGPKGVRMCVRHRHRGRGVGIGGLGKGVRYWRVKGPKGIMGRIVDVVILNDVY